MAGDWIKIEHVTPDKPEVFQVAERLGIDPDAVIGKLIRVWVWADQQTRDGNAPSVTRSLLDRLSAVSGFAEALEAVGWLSVSDDGIQFANFDRHNGSTAKTRALGKRRTQAHREVKRNCNGPSVTPALPEKRREEKRRENTDTQSAKPEKTSDPPKPGSNVPPTVQEVTDHIVAHGCSIDPEHFWHHYETRGWLLSNGKKMKNWHSAIQTWVKNGSSFASRNPQPAKSTCDLATEAERILVERRANGTI